MKTLSSIGAMLLHFFFGVFVTWLKSGIKGLLEFVQVAVINGGKRSDCQVMLETGSCMKKCFGCSFLAVLIGSYLSSNHQVASAVMFIGTEVILKLDYLRIS